MSKSEMNNYSPGEKTFPPIKREYTDSEMFNTKRMRNNFEAEVAMDNNIIETNQYGLIYNIKVLVNTTVSGAIIGKCGQTITVLRAKSGAVVKISKKYEFYPGTNERICIITGNINNIITALNFIIDKMHEVRGFTVESLNFQIGSHHGETKLLVHESTALIIVGTGGKIIENIRKHSKCYVHVEEKNYHSVSSQRCITIVGAKENIKFACTIILSIIEDQFRACVYHATYPNVSNPNSASPTPIPGTAANALTSDCEIYLSFILGAQTSSLLEVRQILDNIRVKMLSKGYSEANILEMCAALGVVSKYGVLSMGVGAPHTNGAHIAVGRRLNTPMFNQQTIATSTAIGNYILGPYNQVSPSPQVDASADSLNNNSLALSPYERTGQDVITQTTN